ncbi:uncharacterized protein LAESUDRAFT_611876, partial [Laetiporus sulphureus 93-53]
LNETNYTDWVMRMEAELVRKGLWSVVQPEEGSEGETDPKVCWEVLEQVHRAHGFATRMAMRRRMNRMAKGSEEPMSTWIGRIKTQVRHLLHADISVTEEDLILALTSGLGKCYEPLVMALDALPADQLTTENVVAKLLNEEMRQ